MTQKEIAEQYHVTRQTVGYWLKRCGMVRPGNMMSHKDFLPWDIRAEDHNDSIARALRWYSKRAQGVPLAIPEQREVERLTDFLKREGLVVDYSREKGFVLRRRKPGRDKATDVIRRPA
jgi:hypothetical protein